MSANVDIKIRIEAAKAEATLAKLTATVQKAAEGQKQMTLKTQILEKKLAKTGETAKRAGRGFKIADIAMASFIGNITSRAVSAGITSLINGMKGLIGAGRDFEAGLVNVSKTTGISGKALESLGRSIQNVGKEIPVSTAALLEIATVAGQLGLKGSANIIAFTETMAKLQLATDITGEAGSQAVAKILDITGELEENGTKNIEKFGSVITKLGNDFAATESQILKVANEIAKGTAAFGVSSEDVLGLAAAFKVTGSEAESSGSAIQRTFIQIGKAVNAGGKELETFSDAAGMTGEEFTQLFKSDPTKAFLALTKGLGDTTTNGAELASKLGELGLGSLRVTKALVPLISRYGVLARSISTARQESEDLTALDEEALKAKQTLAADVQLLSNAFDRFGTLLFDKIGPALRSIVQGMTDFLDVAGSILNRKVLIGIAGGVTAVAVGLLGLNKALILVALKSLPLAIVAVYNFAAAMTVATGGLNLIIPALAAVGIATALYVDSLGDAERSTEQHKDTVEELSGAYENLDSDTQTYIDSLTTSVTGVEKADLVHQRYGETILDASVNLRELSVEEIAHADAAKVAAKTITLFSQKKTAELKKFFKEEEIAKLSAAFLMQKSDEDRLAFTQFVVSQGKALRTDAFKTTIGQGKAQVAAERARQTELKAIRSAEDQYNAERLAKKEQSALALAQLQLEAREAERVTELLKQEEQITLEDEDFQRYVEFLDKKTIAEIKAKLESVTNEEERLALLAQLRSKAAAAELKAFNKNLDSKKQAETLLARTQVGIAGDTANLITAIAGKETKAAFLLSKAAALANIIINTQVAASHATAQLGVLAAPAVAAIEVRGAIQAATVVASAIQGFEQGGIVGGSSFTGDKVRANVNSGEMILNRSQQKNLFAMANGGRSEDGKVINITVQSMLDGEKISESVSQHVANGLVLGEVQ